MIMSLRNEASSRFDPSNPYGVSARAGWTNQFRLAGGTADLAAKAYPRPINSLISAYYS